MFRLLDEWMVRSFQNTLIFLKWIPSLIHSTNSVLRLPLC